MFRPLTPDEIADKDGLDTQEQFMAKLYERLGSLALPREAEGTGLENTMQYDPYEDETQNEQSFPQLTEALKHTPEIKDHHIGADILMPGGDEIERGHVVACS